MTAVFEAWYDDRNAEERERARDEAGRVRERLAEAGIPAEVEDDPPWPDRKGGYVTGPDGRFVVSVENDHANRARELVHRQE
jgi:hypothetical protein